MTQVHAVDEGLRARELTKAFGPLVAVDRVSVHLRPGRIHAIMGENGAGKSTLLRMLMGMLPPDSGAISIGGRPVEFRSARDAFHGGIGMVHQHFMLVPSMTVAENLLLYGDGILAGRRRMTAFETELAEFAEGIGLSITPSALVRDLSIGEMQRVEIVKALHQGARVLLLDEPTAVLSPGEVDRLLESVRRLSAQGTAVALVTHRMREVLDVADEVSVLRHGTLVGHVERDAADERSLVRMMIGRDLQTIRGRDLAVTGAVALEVRQLSMPARPGSCGLNDVSFKVREGEIVGVAGVEGNGQAELVSAIVGQRRVAPSSVSILGRHMGDRPLKNRHDLGLAHVPEDREHRGGSRSSSVIENFQIRLVQHPHYRRIGFIRRRKLRALCQEALIASDVRGGGVDAQVGNLSGGNMQKLIVSRELQGEPKVLVAAQPTRGVDIGAIESIHKKILDLADEGMAVLLVSADLDEILALSDRIIVMAKGAVALDCRRSDVTVDQLGLAMAGQAPL